MSRPEQSQAARREARSHHLWTTYGLTLEQEDALLEIQGHRCAILTCRRPFGRGNSPNVDHDEDTGRVRGLLCARCNRFLTEALIDYLKNPPALKAGVDHVVPAPRRAAMVHKRELDRARRRRQRAGQVRPTEEAGERTTYHYGSGRLASAIDRLEKEA